MEDRQKTILNLDKGIDNLKPATYLMGMYLFLVLPLDLPSNVSQVQVQRPMQAKNLLKKLLGQEAYYKHEDG